MGTSIIYNQMFPSSLFNSVGYSLHKEKKEMIRNLEIDHWKIILLFLLFNIRLLYIELYLILAASRGDFSWECGGTFSQNSYKHFQDL